MGNNYVLRSLLRSVFLSVFLMTVFGVVYNENYAFAKSIHLEKGKTSHFEDIDETDAIYIPSGNCYYTVRIQNIKLKKEDGSITTDYNQYIQAWYVEDDSEYFCENGEISFKKTGKTDAEYRRFYLQVDIVECPVFLYNYSISCDITIIGPDVSSMILTKTNLVCYLDNIDGKEISIKNSSGAVKWSLTNTKIAKIYRDGNSVTICPKKPGTCYLEARCNGRTLKCKVKIKGRNRLYAGGTLETYNTRSNIFTMKFKNCSNKKLTISPKGAIAVDADYTSYDRNLKIGKSICIKPGQEKRIKFKVVGRYTWYNVNDFCINYSVKYKGKNYRLASDSETTWIRRKGKWKTLLTYDEIGYY